MGKVIVVVGGQYGSEAKGHICSYLGEQEQDLFAIRVGGPNAGHTVYDYDGQPWPFRHLPVATVRPARRSTGLAIAAGSEIDYGVLHDEVTDAEKAGHSVDLVVDYEATLLESHHRTAEANGLTGAHGSTQKGIGAARAERLLRKAKRAQDCPAIQTLGHGVKFGNVAALAHEHLAHGGTVLIEGTQGYGLGTSAGDYPYATSGNCRAIDFLAQAGISPWDPAISDLQVWVVFRTFPIRIAGNSGPMRNETSFEDIADGVNPEYTTVTKKLRRVAEWDQRLAWDAIHANGSDVNIALTFFDYTNPEFAGAETLPGRLNYADPFFGDYPNIELEITKLQNRFFAGRHIDLVTSGPTTIIDRRNPNER